MELDQLTLNAFCCSYCEGTGLPFVRSEVGKFYRFPPTIGAVAQAPLLFVGINPRVSDSNRLLHKTISADYGAFVQLSRNRVGGRPYIGLRGLEKHYTLHATVAKAISPFEPFESVASVTELHLCASGSSHGLPPDSSRCAERYFRSILQIVSPTVVLAVGKQVERTLKSLFSGRLRTVYWNSGSAPVVTLPHPAAWGPKQRQTDEAIRLAKSYFKA
jgi:uracil-DNA glycosylase